MSEGEDHEAPTESIENLKCVLFSKLVTLLFLDSPPFATGKFPQLFCYKYNISVLQTQP